MGSDAPAARKLLFVHGVRCAALLGIGGGSAARTLLFVHGVRFAALLLGNCFLSMGSDAPHC